VETYQIQWSLVRNILYSISFDKVLIFEEKLSGQTNLSSIRHKISACLTECQTRVSGISPGLWKGFELTTFVVISTYCTGSCKSNYHMITTTMATNTTFNNISFNLWQFFKTIFNNVNVSVNLWHSDFLLYQVHLGTVGNKLTNLSGDYYW